MSIKIQYNNQLLEKLCLRDECVVDFTIVEKYNRNIKVDFICKCGNTNNENKNDRMERKNKHIKSTNSILD